MTTWLFSKVRFVPPAENPRGTISYTPHLEYRRGNCHTVSVEGKVRECEQMRRTVNTDSRVEGEGCLCNPRISQFAKYCTRFSAYKADAWEIQTVSDAAKILLFEMTTFDAPLVAKFQPMG